MNKVRILFPSFIDSILNSYTQVFFSNNRIFAGILLVVTFFDFTTGLCGIISVILSNILAYLIGFNRQNIKLGYYGFNSLLVGLGLGSYYQFNPEFLLILVCASLLTLFLTIMFEGIIGKYGLPFLSLSFLMAIWIFTMATRDFSSLKISERGIYALNDMYAVGGPRLVRIYEWFGNLKINTSIILYFRSLGAIFFQHYLLAGFLIAIGLLIYSRIAFLLSLIGFFSAYVFYSFIGADFSELSNSYIGFNFILTAIAIGGFFIISSRYSFLWVILLTPVISVIIAFASNLLAPWQLPIYSLPFNLVVLMFLFVMKARERFWKKPELVVWQQFSPEKNLYIQLNEKERFADAVYFPVSLPFIGEWGISQAHNGELTHQGDWNHAWDFEIYDMDGHAFKDGGTFCEDYFCFNKPVIAPLDGIIEDALDYIDDNKIGEVNTTENWGNLVVIKHAEGLYTTLCHLKKGSLKVKKGDGIKKGEIIAHCGNSGRSPKPHLHFQMQATPFLGSKTLDYPIGHFINSREGISSLQSYKKPKVGERVSNIETSDALVKAFSFIPGQTFTFLVEKTSGESSQKYHWEIIADYYNQTYIYCHNTGSKAYYKINDNLFYFTHFTGNKHTLLFYFYLSAYKVLLGYYKGMIIKDSLPLNVLHSRILIYLQDFIAPFWIFMKTNYTLGYQKKQEDFTSGEIAFLSSVEVKTGSFMHKKYNFSLQITNCKIQSFCISVGSKNVTATLLNDVPEFFKHQINE
jgi:urea transporter